MNNRKTHRVFFIIIAILLSSISCVYAIWPFDTPESEARLICKNAANQAAHAAESRGIMSYGEWLEEFNDAEWRKPEYYLDRREVISAIRTAYKNPNVSPETIRKMVREDCDARRSQLIEEIKKRNSRNNNP